MPNDTIDRAIRRGTGEEEGVNYEEITYEGYGPGGVALMVQSLTDNRNRTVAEIRHIFSKNGGNLGESGSVGWMFEKKGYIVVEKAAKSEEELFELAIDAGADDLRDDEDNFEIMTSPSCPRPNGRASRRDTRATRRRGPGGCRAAPRAPPASSLAGRRT